MPKQKSTHCKRGHLFKNEIWFIDINGKRQRKCKKCHNLKRAEKLRFKYRNDEEFRKKQKAKTRFYYHKKKAKCRALQDQNLTEPNLLY